MAASRMMGVVGRRMDTSTGPVGVFFKLMVVVGWGNQ